MTRPRFAVQIPLAHGQDLLTKKEDVVGSGGVVEAGEVMVGVKKSVSVCIHSLDGDERARKHRDHGSALVIPDDTSL